MRTFLRAILFRVIWGAAVLSSFAGGAAFSAEPLFVGQKAPTFALPDADGKTFDLAAHRGQRPLILVFYRGYF